MVYFGIAVWGEKFLDTFLNLALPSFLASDNIPACSKVADVNFVIVTRPEDVSSLSSHPSMNLLSKYATVDIEATLSPDELVGGRYDILAKSHRSIITKCHMTGGILSILTPDCVVANGGLSFGLKKVLAGFKAIQVIGPRALMDTLGRTLRAPPFANADGSVISIADKSLVSLLSTNPHPMTQWLFWNADPFSQFPSTLYWQAGKDSILARAFHLHPLFIDLADTNENVRNCGTVDASLISLSKIQQNQIYITKHSSEICVVEFSTADHDAMGSIPAVIADRTSFMINWARQFATSEHVKQFMEHQFYYQGLAEVDWKTETSAANQDLSGTMSGLRELEAQRKAESHNTNRPVNLMQCAKHWIRRPRETGKRALFALASFLALNVFNRPLGLFVSSSKRTKNPSVKIIFLSCLLYLYRFLDRLYTSLPYSNKFALIRPSINQGYSLINDLQIEFDSRIVPTRAASLGQLGHFLHYLFRTFNIVFVVNMIPGMGHNTAELDYFLRMKVSGAISDDKRLVLLRAPSSIHNDTLELYRHHFWFASNNRFLVNFVAPITARFEDIRLNVGLSRLRSQLRDDGSWSPPPTGTTYLHQISKLENVANWQTYFETRQTTRNLAPLKERLGESAKLRDFISKDARIALIHIKDMASNATAAPTDPSTYIPTIQFLQENKFAVVMIGREAMPNEFSELGVIDYAGSPIASYKHDLQLVALADVVVTAGSGIAIMPDCMNIPLVYTNSWHLGMPLPSEYSIIVPTLMLRRSDGRHLSIHEQTQLYWDLEDQGPELFPDDIYLPRNADADEILEATKEALDVARGQPLSLNQQKYFQNALTDQNAWLGSRVSAYFIEKHSDLLKSPKGEN